MKTISVYFFVVALSVGTHSWSMKEIDQVVDEDFVKLCVKKTLAGMPGLIVFGTYHPFWIRLFKKTLEKNNSRRNVDKVDIEELLEGELKFLKKKRDLIMDEVKRTKGKSALKDYSTMFADCMEGGAPLSYSIFKSKERSLYDFFKINCLPEVKDKVDEIVRCVKGKMLLWYNEYFFDPSTQQKRDDLFNTYKFSDYLKDEVFGPYLGKPICEVKNQFNNEYKLFLKKESCRIMNKLVLIHEILTLALVNQLAPNREPDQDEETLKKVSK